MERNGFKVSVGDAALIKSEEKNNWKWPLAIVRAICHGRDGLVRGIQHQTGKGLLERPVQHLHLLELACDKVPEKKQPMNPEARKFIPKRVVAEVAATKIELLLAEEK